MSLLILASLIGIGCVIMVVLRSYENEYKENDITEYASSVLVGYIMVLLFSAIACLGFGVYWWLKNGDWLTVSPDLLSSYLEQDSPIRQLLLTNTSWAGLQKINDWYLLQNVGWSFILTIVVLFMILVFTTDKNI